MDLFMLVRRSLILVATFFATVSAFGNGSHADDQVVGASFFQDQEPPSELAEDFTKSGDTSRTDPGDPAIQGILVLEYLAVSGFFQPHAV